jgi:hypothetical protein
MRTLTRIVAISTAALFLVGDAVATPPAAPELLAAATPAAPEAAPAATTAAPKAAKTPAATAAETAKAKALAAAKAKAKAAAEAAAEEVIDLLKSLETAPTAGQALNHLVPLYRGEEITDRALAGTVIVQDTAKAVSAPDHLQAGRLQAAEIRAEVFVKNTLGQETLHVPAYRDAQVVAAISGDIKMTEEIIRARLEDEREIESMANPGWVARIKWWWNS